MRLNSTKKLCLTRIHPLQNFIECLSAGFEKSKDNPKMLYVEDRITILWCKVFMMLTRDNRTTIQEIKIKINSFVEKRDWDQFHSPKNLSMAIAVEASELMERFLWSTTDESLQVGKKGSDLRKIEAEVADIAIYLISLCNKMGIDLSHAIFQKIKKNEKKYPANRVKGKAHKYTYYRKIKK